MPTPLLAVLSRSESFSEFWPKLAGSARGRLAVVESIPELEALEEPCGVIVAAAGVEYDALSDLEEISARVSQRVCLVGAATEHRLGISVLRSGAEDYFALPADIAALRGWAIERADREVTAEKARALTAEHRERYDFSRMIGESRIFAAALARAAKVIPRSGATVLIQGETGTGKELLARAIHYNGPRASKPFVEVNSAALPENLLESELFGFEPGAFTDARVAKPGLIEVADGGTLFLDEVGDLPLGLQGKILRVLADRQVRRLGALKSTAVDVRFIAATNVDLALAAREKRFREDLYFRLNVVPIRLPPLRERGEDVLLLAHDFVEQFGREYERPGLQISEEVKRSLLSYPWPGNVRELRNVIERAVLLGEGPLKAQELFSGDDSGTIRPGNSVLPFPASIREIEVAAAHAALDHHGGNKTRAAAMLGISRKYLYQLLRDSNGAHAQR